MRAEDAWYLLTNVKRLFEGRVKLLTVDAGGSVDFPILTAN